MASDMVVALASATADRRALFGHNGNALLGAPVREPGRDHSPGEVVQVTHARVPQARQTHAFVGSRVGREWGCPHGVNDRGVALGCTPVHTRLQCDEPGLAGPDLVRLGLERAGSACQAVEVLTDLIGRHGQEGASSFLVADAAEAFVLEAAGHHWALGHVGSVRAVAAACLLRQDWDRISRGLSDLAIGRGWWPGDGRKLDFAGAVGREGPEHRRALRRWGQLTMALEAHSGEITAGTVRRLLHEPGAADEAGCRFVARLGAGEVPMGWWAVGEAEAVYVPVFPFAEPPPALGAVRAPAGQSAALQGRLDADLGELLPEANDLYRRGDGEGLRRLVGSFMQHCVERLEDAAERPGRPRAAALAPGAAF
jgi:hypothetical protein